MRRAEPFSPCEGRQPRGTSPGGVDGAVVGDVVPVVAAALGGEQRGEVDPVDAELVQVRQLLGRLEQVEVLGDLEPVGAGGDPLPDCRLSH